VWTALYEYRSRVAHGVRPNFNDRDLRILRGPIEAEVFARVAARALMRHTLEEPELVKDLKAC
jgi:hypothetical protein